MKVLAVVCLAPIALCLSAAIGATAQAEPVRFTSGIDLNALDRSVRPQDDLYRFVNGKWLEATEMPADKASYGSFDIRYEESLDQLRGVIEAAARDTTAPEASEVRKIGSLYRSFLDEAAADKLGVAPLQGELDRIAALRDKHELAGIVAHLQQLGVTAPLGQSVHLDNRDSSRYVFDVAQDGLGMPDRDYYLKDEAELKKARAEYQAHIRRSLALIGERDPDGAARGIVALEAQLAKAQWSKVQNRDPLKVYNKVEIARLRALAPNFDWSRYLVASGVEGRVDYLIVSQPSYLSALSAIVDRTPLPIWKSYLRWHLLSAYSPYLSQQLVDENFRFYHTVLEGVPQNRPRWKRGVTLVDESMGEALGKLYVAKYFPQQSKARVESLVRNLLEAFRRDIDELDWMGPQTRKEAHVKLAAIATKIGYPGQWRDYRRLEIRADDLVGNVMRARQFEFRRNVEKLGKPVDRSEWMLPPQAVNAYYDPEMNEIVFPAAILQPPFFDSAADDAVNYGGIGVVIGHEISHAFDDQGSQYDEKGNLRNWWTEQDRREFAARANALVAEYSAFEPVRGYRLNGELTLGENIADNSGLAVAYKAYQISLGTAAAPVLDGFTGDQRFFMGLARIWRDQERDSFLIESIKSDPHAPPKYRVLGSVVNQPVFYRAFDVKEGDRLYLPPTRRVIMW